MEQLDKNAFQWDAYRTLVDRIPACTAGGVCPVGGVSAWGCLPSGGVSTQVEGVSQHPMGQTPPVDRQTLAKT